MKTVELPETIKANALRDGLPNYRGSETFYRHFTGVIYTEGVAFVADTGDANWLIDLIAGWQYDPKVKKQDFQVFVLSVHQDNSATMIITDGNENEIGRQDIPYSDFPLPEITIWFANNTIYLPSEH